MQREHGVQSGTGVCQESKTCPYDSHGRKIPGIAKMEELITTGIFDTYQFNENKLRQEHGYNFRIKY